MSNKKAWRGVIDDDGNLVKEKVDIRKQYVIIEDFKKIFKKGDRVYLTAEHAKIYQKKGLIK